MRKSQVGGLKISTVQNANLFRKDKSLVKKASPRRAEGERRAFLQGLMILAKTRKQGLVFFLLVKNECECYERGAGTAWEISHPFQPSFFNES